MFTFPIRNGIVLSLVIGIINLCQKEDAIALLISIIISTLYMAFFTVILGMQKILDLQSKYKIYKDKLIISSSNFEAYNTIIKRDKWQDNRILLIGPKKSGKTLLANLWQRNTGAMLINNLDDLDESDRVIVDDLETFKDEDLINIINYAQEKSTTLLLTSSHYPSCKLKDLNSRIKSTYQITIKDPDEKLAKLLIARFFKKKQILISNDIIDLIYQNIERKYSVIDEVLNILDQHSMITKRRITPKFIKEVL